MRTAAAIVFGCAMLTALPALAGRKTYVIPVSQYRPETITVGAGQLVRRGSQKETKTAATFSPPHSMVVYVRTPSGRKRTLLYDAVTTLREGGDARKKEDRIHEVSVLGIMTGIKTDSTAFRFPMPGVPARAFQPQEDWHLTTTTFKPIAPQRQAEIKAALEAVGVKGLFRFE